MSQFFGTEGTVEVHPQLDEDLIKVMILLLHLLVMASALLSLPTFHKISHALEDFVCPPQVLQNEMPVVDFKKEVVKPIFLISPMSFLNIFGLSF